MQAVGYLLVLITVIIHVKRTSEFFVKFLYSFFQLNGIKHRFWVGVGVRIADVQIVKVFTLVDDGFCFLGSTIVVDENVLHDGIYPCLEIIVIYILFFVNQSFEKCFLRQVFGVVFVASQLFGKCL